MELHIVVVVVYDTILTSIVDVNRIAVVQRLATILGDTQADPSDED
jgi:hypothetical protein